ncbi:MAG: DUF262 domain-containing protein [Candidatus Omnitrophica bacterium]|nr:DUF262 domain-containing protein [Candidatus Omnitrophota bacterium]
MNIRQIIDKINDNQLFVPAFQREYVWKRDDVKALFDSLIKKHPYGTLLTWETTNPPELKGKVQHNAQMGAVKLILDGQQRITSLYMIITGEIPPYYTQADVLHEVKNLYVNLDTLELGYHKPTIMDNDPLWCHLTAIFKGEIKPTSILKAIGDDEKLRNKADKILENLETVKSIQDRDFVEQSIPVTASIKNAIDIFYIVNASGVTLTDAELALAQISGYWPKARDLIKKKLNGLKEKGFVFNLDFIVYVLLGILHHMGSEMKKLHSDDNKEKLQSTWKILDEQVLDYVLNIMQNRAYIDHTKEINSVYALIPIVVYVFNKKDKKLDEHEIKIILKWFYYSQIRFRYISQLPQKLDKDIGIVVKSKNPFDELITIIDQERPLKIVKEEFVGRDVRHPLFSLMRWYFKSRNAVCLGTGIGIRQNMGKKYSLEYDHIFAWSILRDAGYNMNNRHKYSLAQEITNRAILTQEENRKKEAKYADVYLKSVKEKFPDALRLQSIPEDENLWKLENYEKFIDKRREMLADELNAFLSGITATKEGKAEVTIEDMISAGENSLTEFKTTLRWDLREGKINKKLEEVVIKTIAGFNNAEGGTLIMGVDDDYEIIGLDFDYNTLRDGDKDKFEIHLRNLINEAYGVEFGANNILIKFPIIEEKEVCVVDIKKGDKPIYTKMTDKNGQKSEKFYVRSGNSSQEISGLGEITSYIKSRFKS